VIAGKADSNATANADTVKTGEELDSAAAAGTTTTMPDQPSSSALESPDRSMKAQEPSAAVDYTPAPPAVEQPNEAMTGDQSEPVITAPVVEERVIIIEPADSAAATDELPSQPLNQSPTANDDVVRTSPLPTTDNGRADSATTQDDLNAQTR